MKLYVVWTEIIGSSTFCTKILTGNDPEEVIHEFRKWLDVTDQVTVHCAEIHNYQRSLGR